MITKPSASLIQATLWVCLLTVAAAVVLAAVYTNTTLRSVEKNLPNTLIVELNSLSTVLDDIHEVVTATRFARATMARADFEQLRQQVEKAAGTIRNLRDTFVMDNLVNASAFHAVVAPAVADLQIWLSQGISGYSPDSEATLDIAQTRIDEAYGKASRLKLESHSRAQDILGRQMKRLEEFQTGVTVLFLSTLTVAGLLIVLLIRQTILVSREFETKAELVKQHYLFESLLQNLPLGVAVWDKDKNIIHLNRRFTEITGYDRNDMPHLSNWPLLAYPDPDYREQVRRHWKQLDKATEVGEYKVTCKSGEVKDIEFRATFLPDARVFNTFTDVTERNQREAALRESRRIEARARKMESLGLLAGGVAHDLNNILSGIVSYPELILMDLDHDDKLRKPIETMRDSGKKATAIVQDLLTVARGVAIAKEPINLNDIVANYLESPDFLLLRKYHPAVTVDVCLSENLRPILGSTVHLRKILMNLVSNGCEAIENSGAVSISTANRFLDTPFQGYEEIEEGDFVMLTVADQGSGIPENDLERIFEPFYTKKVMGRSGTGLGLAVVWNVVQDHGGYINVASSSAGTSFHVYFPVTEQAGAPAETAQSLRELRGNGEFILVVDDISSQRLITTSILTKLNYRAEAVPSGEAAVAFVKDRRVDLLLLDMIMDPGMNGRQTYEQILQLYPGQKAIIVSGYAETEDVKATLDLGASRFLKKPLLFAELGTAIKEALRHDR